MVSTTAIQKLVTFSSQLYKLGSERAKKLGLPFNEYIRYLLANDISRHEEYIEVLDEETERDIGEAIKDIENGHYITLQSKQDIKNFLDQIDKEVTTGYVHDKNR